MMRWKPAGPLVLVAVLLGTPLASAEIYKRRDANGRLVFTNAPSPARVSTRQLRSPRAPGQPAALPSRARHFRQAVEAAANRHRIDRHLIWSVMQVESDLNPRARSRKGAEGLMQLMPKTQKMLGVKNPYNTDQNIDAGARYLADLLKRYHGKVELALAAYNAGPTAVEKYQGIPPFPETRRYVEKVMRLYRGRPDPPAAPRKIYRFQDATGRWHYSDRPPTDRVWGLKVLTFRD